MRKTVLNLLLPLVIIIVSLDGCIPSKPTEEVEVLPAERLVNKLELNRRRIKNFEGSGTINIKTSQLNNSAAFNVVMQKPDSISLTIMGPFGIELAQALVTKKDFIFYDALQNTAYEGEVNEDILKNIFKINLSFSELMDAFIGSVNLTEKLYKPPAKYQIDYDKYILTYVDSLSGNSTVYSVDIRQLGLTNYQLTDDKGNILLDGKYSKFKLLENVPVPYKIEINNRMENQDITIDYKKMAANEKRIYIDFKLPSDATIIKW